MASAAAGSDDDDGYDDFTLATPWERCARKRAKKRHTCFATAEGCLFARSFVAALEEVLSGWLAAGPEALAAESEAAACAPAAQRARMRRPLG
jgi:nucleoside phosphorylase